MKILIFLNNNLGDIILSTGLYSYYANVYKEAQFSIVCPPHFHSLFKEAPRLDACISYLKNTKNQGRLAVWTQCLSHRWDYVLDVKNTYYSRLLLTKNYKAWRCDKKQTIHRVDSLNACFNLPQGWTPHVWVNPLMVDSYSNHFRTKGPRTLALAPMSRWIGKIWPYFPEFIQQFQRTYPKDHLLVTCAPSEQHDLHRSLASLDKTNITFMDQEKDLSKTAAALKACDFFMGNDSGLMHMAAALKIPTLGLFGPSNEKAYGPYGEKNIIIRTPLSLKKIEALPNFRYDAPVTFMNSLNVCSVWTIFEKEWRKKCQ